MNKDQIEIERKYIIKKPSVDHMRMMPKFSESDITQIYIESAAGITHRVRRRASGEDGPFLLPLRCRRERARTSRRTCRRISSAP